ncbi:hypothetical protein KIPE111705_15100 [Kibdelosporangium persicum]|uniref:PE family protein n=1 Tax=Kibdelosporangium persicum TaxID=2698649 RepID=A0ABX2FF55_9PSEU|nr:hypothetical protein [Kibdelosporangium persicum]NRN69515.1 hypothetical protein [Kibdelosporangium persicum]
MADFHVQLDKLLTIANKNLPAARESLEGADRYLQNISLAHGEAFEDRTAQTALMFNGDYASVVQGNPFLENSQPGGLYKNLEQEFASVRQQLRKCLQDLGHNVDLSSQALREVVRRYAEADGQTTIVA